MSLSRLRVQTDKPAWEGEALRKGEEGSDEARRVPDEGDGACR